MRNSFSHVSDPELQRALDEISATFDNISVDNFKTFLIKGTTASSGDAQGLFMHSLNTTPRGYWRIEGDVYIPSGGFGPKQVDVRSRLASHAFKILVFT